MLAALIGFPLFLALGALGVFMFLNSPPPYSSVPVAISYASGMDLGIWGSAEGGYFIEVRRGESAQSVGRRLYEAGLIRNRYFWNGMSRLSGDFVRAGTYRLEMPLSQMAIHQVLVSGRQVLTRVTIPEGVTLRRAGIILEDAGIVSLEDFMQAATDQAILDFFRIPNSSMEGYLFPDTYLFPANYPAASVVRAMAENFFRRLYELYPQAVNLSPQELNDIVILASIVEREHRLAEEAPIMAGVFSNRLRIGMLLQSCATVEFIITEILGRPHPQRIFYRDLEIVNPFNTYMFRGLPPGPISAPGANALAAAFNPAPTEYLFFRLVDPATGRHHFSRTMAEHVRAGQLLARNP